MVGNSRGQAKQTKFFKRKLKGKIGIKENRQVKRDSKKPDQFFFYLTILHYYIQGWALDERTNKNCKEMITIKVSGDFGRRKGTVIEMQHREAPEEADKV